MEGKTVSLANFHLCEAGVVMVASCFYCDMLEAI